MGSYNISKKFPLNLYVVQSIVTCKGMYKLHKITDTILEGLPHIKTHKLLGNTNNSFIYPDPCIVVPYNHYICNILIDLVDSIRNKRTFYYDPYKYWYTDKNGYHYYKPILSAFRDNTIKLSPIEAADCLLED